MATYTTLVGALDTSDRRAVTYLLGSGQNTHDAGEADSWDAPKTVSPSLFQVSANREMR
jgi:hypothetical protein